MDDQGPAAVRPLWVRIALCGVGSRASAWLFVWLCLGLTAASVALGFVKPWFFGGCLFALGALGYYLAIKWVDRNDRW